MVATEAIRLISWTWPAILAFILSSIIYSLGGLLLQYYILINLFGTYVAYQDFKINYRKRDWILTDYMLQSIPKKNWFDRLFPDDMFWVWMLCFVIKLSVFLSSVYMYEHNMSVSRTNWLIDTFNIIWWDAEGLSDFAGDYIMFRNNFLAGEPLYGPAFNGRYLYPPLYYYIVNVFAVQTIYSAPIVMLICNMMTGYFLYHLVKEMGATDRNAKLMLILQLLSPINLYYSDFIWQNAGVFTTFVVWSMLCITREQYKRGMFILGIAISIKQVAAFFLPIFLFGIIYLRFEKKREHYVHKLKLLEYLRSIPWSALIFYGLIPVEVFLLSSLPYIVTIPETYLGYLVGGFGVDIPGLKIIFNQVVPIYAEGHFMGYFPDLNAAYEGNFYRANYRAALDVAFAWIGHLMGVPSIYTVWFSILFHTQLLFYGSLVVIFIIYWIIIKNKATVFHTDRDFYWLMWFAGNLMFFACLLLVEKGIYKYYLLTMTPFWSTFSAVGGLNHEKWRNSQTWSNQLFGGGSLTHLIMSGGLQLGILLCNKWLAPAFIYLPLFLIDCFRLLWRMPSVIKIDRFRDKFGKKRK
jgi:hypothetical protein